MRSNVPPLVVRKRNSVAGNFHSRTYGKFHRWGPLCSQHFSQGSRKTLESFSSRVWEFDEKWLSTPGESRYSDVRNEIHLVVHTGATTRDNVS